MEILGLHSSIWFVLALYIVGMLLLGWWSKRGTHSQEGYLMGGRQFGVPMMIMHAFGAGTHPGDVAGVVSETVSAGASGIWVSWMWMFGTPFYWIIAPMIRRMRCLTLADYFQERYNKTVSVLYVIVASIGMTIAVASVLLATTRTVQGMMGKAMGAENDVWFYGILLVTTFVFMVYCYWGGLVAAVRTDFVQGLMIIALSFLAIPAALRLPEVGGLAGMRATVGALGAPPGSYLSLFDPRQFSLWTVVLLCINAPLSMLAQPHVVTVCGAGRTEWEGRMGFTYGNVLKRICTMGWCLLALCWLAYLVKTGSSVHPDAAFGDSIRALLSPLLQGLMLACVLAAGMSTGSAVQVTVAGLFSQNIYRVFINPAATDERLVRVSKLTGLAIVFTALIVALLMSHSIVRTILDYFNITGLLGASVAMGLLWRRMNSKGALWSIVLAVAAFILTRYVLNCPRLVTIGVPMLTGIVGGIVGSLLTEPPKPEAIDGFFKRIHVPIGQEKKLDLPLDEAIPAAERWVTTGGLFLVKPSTQSWVGFLVTLAVCLAAIGVMLALI